MGGRRVGLAVLDCAETVIRFAANATNSVWHSKIVLLGALGALLVLAAVPILSHADMPSVAASGTLTCYDRAGMPILCRADKLPVTANTTLKCYSRTGNYQPCVTQARVWRLRPIVARQSAGWTTSAPYQEANPATAAPAQQASGPYQQASGATAAPDQQARPVTAALEQQASATASPVVLPAYWTPAALAARRTIVPAKRRVVARCRRHSLTCFFSALRRGVTHIASVAATMGRPPGREHL